MTYSCFAYQYPVFQPAMRIIAALSTSNPAIVTTTFNHQYLTGTIVRLDISKGVGMSQANQLTGTITVLSPTTFAIDINTSNFDPYVIPSPAPAHYTCSQVVPIGEVNELLSAAVHNVLPY